MSKETIVKMSYKAHALRRFENTEFSTNKYLPMFNVPRQLGYVFDDFGLDYIRELQTNYENNFQRESYLVIADAIYDLEAKIRELCYTYEQAMVDEAVKNTKPSKIKEAAE